MSQPSAGMKKSEDFLITTSVGDRTRKFVWKGDHPVELDLPLGWSLEEVNGQFRVSDLSLPYEERLADAIVFDPPEMGGKQLLDLPAARGNARHRAVGVEITHLRHARPVYLSTPGSTNNLQIGVPMQLTLYYGQRYFMIACEATRPERRVGLGGREIFAYGKTAEGYWVTSASNGLRIKVGGKSTELVKGQTYHLTKDFLFSGTLIWGVHWWRLRMAPTPDAQPPIETTETEAVAGERRRMQLSIGAFGAAFAFACFAIIGLSLNQPEKPHIIATQVELKTPKLIPPSPTKKPDPPKPVVVVPPPKPPPVVKVEPPKPKPQPVVKAEPKPKPKPVKAPPKKVAAKKPSPKPVAKAPAPAPPKPQPPKGAPKIAEKGPTPLAVPKPPAPPDHTGEAAAQKAAQAAAQKQQLLQKLSFLSTSDRRVKVDPEAYKAKEGKYSNSPVAVGADVSTTTNLDKVVKGASGDGNIKTNSSRSISSAVDFGDAKGKGLNDVQGKVSSRELASSGGNIGDVLGGELGVEMSGAGQLDSGAVEAALAKFLQRFQFCYEKALLTTPTLAGKVRLQWTISTAGRASGKPKILSSQLNDKGLHDCLGKVLNEIPFPKPKGGAAIAEKTFSFSSRSL